MTIRAVSLPLWFVVLLAAGCAPKPATVAPVTVSAPEEVKLIQDFRALIPAHKVAVERKIATCQRQQERESWWRARLYFAAIVLGLFAGVVLLGRLGFVGGVAGAVLAWIAAKVPTRWLVYAGVAAPACAALAIWIDPVFTFLGWAAYLLAGLVGGLFVWEVASIYYTGKVDMPGDGVKPMPPAVPSAKG